MASWLSGAKETKAALKKAIVGFEKLSGSYESIRNVGYKNDEKEAIDEHYSEVYELHQELCKLKAGGGTRRRLGGRRMTRRSKRV